MQKLTKISQHIKEELDINRDSIQLFCGYMNDVERNVLIIELFFLTAQLY